MQNQEATDTHKLISTHKTHTIPSLCHVTSQWLSHDLLDSNIKFFLLQKKFQFNIYMHLNSRNWSSWRVRKTGSKNLYPFSVTKKCMLELRTHFAIGSGRGPLVGPRNILIGAEIKHWLNGEADSLLAMPAVLLLA